MVDQPDFITHTHTHTHVMRSIGPLRFCHPFVVHYRMMVISNVLDMKVTWGFWITTPNQAKSFPIIFSNWANCLDPECLFSTLWAPLLRHFVRHSQVCCEDSGLLWPITSAYAFPFPQLMWADPRSLLESITLREVLSHITTHWSQNSTLSLQASDLTAFSVSADFKIWLLGWYSA